MNTIVRMFNCSTASVLKKKFCSIVLKTQTYIKSFVKKKIKKKKVNEELLSETVRKYTVVYDKSSADFKDR